MTQRDIRVVPSTPRHGALAGDVAEAAGVDAVVAEVVVAQGFSTAASSRDPLRTLLSSSRAEGGAGVAAVVAAAEVVVAGEEERPTSRMATEGIQTSRHLHPSAAVGSNVIRSEIALRAVANTRRTHAAEAATPSWPSRADPHHRSWRSRADPRAGSSCGILVPDPRAGSSCVILVRYPRCEIVLWVRPLGAILPATVPWRNGTLAQAHSGRCVVLRGGVRSVGMR